MQSSRCTKVRVRVTVRVRVRVRARARVRVRVRVSTYLVHAKLAPPLPAGLEP